MTERTLLAHTGCWRRNEIDWQAPRGRTFQLLGYRHLNLPKLQVCDFRRARGVYVLFNEYGPTYAGQTRGSSDGFGYRLRAHDRDDFKDWDRFCWFSFDDVIDERRWPGWCDVVQDNRARRVTAQSAINDLEALMIVAFGLRGQNQMRLAGAGRAWTQLVKDDCLPGGVARKVAPDWIRMRSLRQALGLETRA